jgi:crotonobetainyl-CoA:carnitine CoA-transferase CaiB-like acyl-CoA transferase
MRNWINGVGLFEEQKLFDDKFGHVFERAKYREEVESLIQPWLDKHRKEDVFHAGQRKGLAFGYLASFQEVFASPQHEARSFFLNIDHPVVGEQKYCGAPFRLTVTPWQKVRAPLLGEHTEEVFHKLRGASPAKADTVRGERGPSAGATALKGVKILDFTHSWAGPHAVRVLADFGADVVRIEYVKRLCALRGARTENEHYNKHPMWFHVNRGKLSITLDIKNRNDRSIVYELVKMSDVVIDNARGGVMERLGLGYDDLIKIKPNVVLVSMASFGKTGPYATYAGYGATMEVVGGVQNLTAYAPDGKPRRIKEVDVINGIVAAGALMTALLHYQRTGQGQWVDMSQLESVTHALIGEHLLEFACNGTQQLPLGNRHRWFAPQGCYKCKGEDRWVTLVVRTDEEWHAFCDLLKHPEWKTDTGFSTSATRAENHDMLDRLIEAWTSSLSHYEAMHLLQGAGIASGAVLDVEDLSKDAHLKEREYFLSATDGVPGLFPGVPIRLSRTPGKVRWRGPDLGQHNEYVICDFLGRSKADIPKVNVEEIGTAYDSE